MVKITVRLKVFLFERNGERVSISIRVDMGLMGFLEDTKTIQVNFGLKSKTGDIIPFTGMVEVKEVKPSTVIAELTSDSREDLLNLFENLNKEHNEYPTLSLVVDNTKKSN